MLTHCGNNVRNRYSGCVFSVKDIAPVPLKTSRNLGRTPSIPPSGTRTGRTRSFYLCFEKLPLSATGTAALLHFSYPELIGLNAEIIKRIGFGPDYCEFGYATVISRSPLDKARGLRQASFLLSQQPSVGSALARESSFDSDTLYY